MLGGGDNRYREKDKLMKFGNLHAWLTSPGCPPPQFMIAGMVQVRHRLLSISHKRLHNQQNIPLSLLFFSHTMKEKKRKEIDGERFFYFNY